MGRVILIDAMNLAHRHWATQKSMTTTSGIGTALVNSFVKSLLSLRDKLDDIDKFIICWDGGKVLRKKMMLDNINSFDDLEIYDKKSKSLVKDDKAIEYYKEHLELGYKGRRKKDNDIQDLYDQTDNLKEYLAVMGFTQIAIPEVEADDVIYWLAKKFYKKDVKVTVLSNDMDFYQLLSNNTSVIVPKYSKNPMDIVELTKSNFSSMFCKYHKEKGYELPLDLYLFYKSISGDTSDNITGVYNVGDKTILGLLADHAYDLEKIEDNKEELMKKKAVERIFRHQSIIELCFSLVDLSYGYKKLKHKFTDDIAHSICAVNELDEINLKKLAKKYELREFLKEFQLNVAKIKRII